jgi:hypothetical protein
MPNDVMLRPLLLWSGSRNGVDFKKVSGTVRGRVWHIDKVVYGKRICESTGTRDRAEAAALLALRVTQARRVHLFGEQREYTFSEAAGKFLDENRHKRSLERDRRVLALLDPFLGSLPLRRVHHDTLAPFI